MNRVVIVGRLTKDPELKKTASGSSVVSFTLAVDSTRRGPNGSEKSACFFPVTAWNATAENVARYMKKGSKVGVDGRLNQRSYQAKDGRNVSVIEIIAEQVEFLEPRGANSGSSYSEPSRTYGYSSVSSTPVDPEPKDGDDSPAGGIDTTDDGLPF